RARRGVRHHGPRASDELLRVPSMTGRVPTELDAVRARLAGARGETWWRTLEEVVDTEAFQALVAREMPAVGALSVDPIRRRAFLKIMAASLSLAGLGGCSGRPPAEPVVPYVRPPEGVVPGKP